MDTYFKNSQAFEGGHGLECLISELVVAYGQLCYVGSMLAQMSDTTVREVVAGWLRY